MLRAINIRAGPGFDTLLAGVNPPSNFNVDSVIFTNVNTLDENGNIILADTVDALIKHFIPGVVGAAALTEI